MPTPFALADAAALIAVPGPDDDKYSRGVLGLVTGSPRYPGAAVLGVEAAWRTGVGMVRYLGAAEPSTLVLQRRPETVLAAGRVQAWVLGSGQDDALEPETRAQLDGALADEVPTVLDGGALERVGDARGPVLLTPHAGELARVLGVEVDEVRGDREGALAEAVRRTGAVVLLKGHATLVAGPGVDPLVVREAPPWLAVAGAGDVLAGVLGALLATD
ncbi:MAG: NAD(P)H-hydrate dehydratase, partial [Actinomycetales bacterium]|nr:NAD(P)H-hydrate dehydratase [Actinomycetales bacterium]